MMFSSVSAQWSTACTGIVNASELPDDLLYTGLMSFVLRYRQRRSIKHWFQPYVSYWSHTFLIQQISECGHNMTPPPLGHNISDCLLIDAWRLLRTRCMSHSCSFWKYLRVTRYCVAKWYALTDSLWTWA